MVVVVGECPTPCKNGGVGGRIPGRTIVVKKHRCENIKKFKKHVLYPIIKNMKKHFKKHFSYST